MVIKLGTDIDNRSRVNLSSIANYGLSMNDCVVMQKSSIHD